MNTTTRGGKLLTQDMIKASAVSRHLNFMAMRLDEVLTHQKPRAAYLCGPTGCGKSRAIGKALESYPCEPVFSQPDNYQDMLRDFASATHGPIVFEEADVIFRSSRMLNILKIATDQSALQREYAGVDISAPVIVATNIDLRDRKHWSKPLLAHGAALFRRSAPVVVPNDPEELWLYTVGEAVFSGLLRTVHGDAMSMATRVKALEWFSLNLHRIEHPSPGVLEEIAGAFHRYQAKPAMLQCELDARLDRTRLTAPDFVAGIDWRASIMEATPYARRAPRPRPLAIADHSGAAMLHH